MLQRLGVAWENWETRSEAMSVPGFLEIPGFDIVYSGKTGWQQQEELTLPGK